MTRARRMLTLHIAARPVGSGIQGQAVHDPRQGKRVGEVRDDFLDFKKTEADPATYRHYVDKLKPFLERFGHRPISTLSERDGIDFKRWVREEREWVKGGKKEGQKSTRVRGVGPATFNHFLR